MKQLELSNLYGKIDSHLRVQIHLDLLNVRLRDLDVELWEQVWALQEKTCTEIQKEINEAK